jgi:hypothetical protein
MATAIDPTDFKWQIKRCWYVPPHMGATGIGMLDVIIFLFVLPFLIAWPFWLASKWLGAPWTIAIKRDGVLISEERVRGWRKCTRRIAELAAEAEAGVLTQKYPARTRQQASS